MHRWSTILLVSVSALIACPAAVAAAPEYDLLLRGGRVIDPANGRDGILDVAVAGGRVARVAPSIDPARAKTVVDASGLVVTPGFVDIHTHVFFGTSRDRYLADSYGGVAPDTFAPRSCTTTVVDAGSAGWRSFPRFEAQTIALSKTRVLAFLNIVGGGMRGGRFEQDLRDMNPRATAAFVAGHRGAIVGLKVAHYAGPGWEPVDRALDAARLSGTRVMVDFGEHVPELSLEDLLLRRLRPGDIYTHVYADVPGRTAVVDARGALRPYVRRAAERGVFFDLGHGGGSFSYGQAIPAIEQGLLPDSISTDIHAKSWNGAMQDLVALLSKLHGLGMSLPDLVGRSTARPAAMIGRPELGRLDEGSEADIAVLRVDGGRFGFADVQGLRVDAARRLTCEVTVRAGKVIWDRDGLSGRPWTRGPRGSP